jgi:hypothetical protein
MDKWKINEWKWTYNGWQSVQHVEVSVKGLSTQKYSVCKRYKTTTCELGPSAIIAVSMIINKLLGTNAIRAVSRIINNPLEPTIMIVLTIISKLLEPNAIMALSTTSNKPLRPSTIMTLTTTVNKLQWKPSTTYLLKAITSSLSLVKHSND